MSNRDSALSLDKGIAMNFPSLDTRMCAATAGLSGTCSRRSRYAGFRKLLVATGSAVLLAVGGNAASAENDYAFVEGNATQLNSLKRVIITNYVVAFQLDGAVWKDDATRVGNTTFFGGNAKEVTARMAWKAPDAAVMQGIADAGLAALKAEFKAKGVEVLDESVLAGQSAYASILEATGLTSLDDYTIVNASEAVYRSGNNTGTKGLTTVSEAKIVSAKGSRPYGHSVFEGGQ